VDIPTFILLGSCNNGQYQKALQLLISPTFQHGGFCDTTKSSLKFCGKNIQNGKTLWKRQCHSPAKINTILLPKKIFPSTQDANMTTQSGKGEG